MKTLLLICCVLMSITLAVAYTQPTKSLPFGPQDIYRVPEGFPSNAVQWPSQNLGAIKTGPQAGMLLVESCDPEGRACALVGAFVDKPKGLVILVFVEVYFIETKVHDSYVHEQFLKTGVPDYLLSCRVAPSKEEIDVFIDLKRNKPEVKKWPI